MSNADINLIRTEWKFPCIFTNFIRKPYGIIFYSEQSKESYANCEKQVFET